jgi:AhpD family alkylhydroperoxidase
MARLPYVDPERAPAPVRQLLERLPAQLNIFRLIAHAETNARPLLALGTSILSAQQLSPRLRELAILRVARLSGAEYEWGQHVAIARAMGVGDEEIAALERGDVAAPAFDPIDRLVLAFTTEVVERVGASAATVAEMQRHFSTREIVELILAIGFYMTLARLMETAAIDLDPPVGLVVVGPTREPAADVSPAALATVLEAYVAAVNERDPAARERCLAAAVTDDFEFVGRGGPVTGRQAFARHLGALQAELPPGAAMALAADPEAHHGWVRFGWTFRRPDGTPVVRPDGPRAGVDVAQLAPNGRLRRVVVFSPPAAES